MALVEIAMDSIYNFDEPPLSKRELTAARDGAKQILRLWVKRLCYCGTALVLCCALLVPFLERHSLHQYWDSVGRYVLLLSMALFFVFVCCAIVTYGAWSYDRGLKTVYSFRLLTSKVDLLGVEYRPFVCKQHRPRASRHCFGEDHASRYTRVRPCSER